jgi:hypothetical protein
VPALPGVSLPHVFTLRSPADAARIAAVAQEKARSVLLPSRG